MPTTLEEGEERRPGWFGADGKKGSLPKSRSWSDNQDEHFI